MEKQVHFCSRFIAVRWDVESVDAVSVAAIETLVQIGKKRIEYCAAGIRASSGTHRRT